MIPLRDTIPSARVPIVNYAVIAANVLVFCYEVSVGGRQAELLIKHWGLVPSNFAVETLLTSMFLHGGWLNVLGNMLYLYIFGEIVEDRLGRLRYLRFILLGAAAPGVTPSFSSA